MKKVLQLLTAIILLAACNNSENKSTNTPVAKEGVTIAPALEEVFSDSAYQLTGVAVAGKRLFVNYPNWLAKHRYSVVEVTNGMVVPYPDERWNSFQKMMEERSLCACNP